MPDKFAATWVSHTSIQAFLHCPRAYYLNNVYRDPETNHKIQLMSPALALGQVVHDVLESLSVLPTDERFSVSLVKRLDTVWRKVAGEKGGFTSESQEHRYRQRAEEMLQKVMQEPGPLAHLAVKIKQELPQFWLSEADEIILCGKIDWLEYFPDQDAVHIIDFKTGKQREEDGSLQLPIYHLLVDRCQQREVIKASYWYLADDTGLVEKELPDLEQAQENVLQVAKKIKTARKLGVFKCPEGENGCFHCRDLEKIVRGDAKKVGVNEYNQDMYIIPHDSGESNDEYPESEIL